MSAHGFHKAIGGIVKRRRETLANLPGKTCRLHPDRPAAGLIETALLDLNPACSACIAYGKQHGYEVVEAEQ